ncbi:Stage II sporulation protein R (spore_II_R) [Caprobacter fermentans]|uniref:Stage II sporulation protein R n=1 Tax=Caproicibacter fermentans TaxID=2576756 RepID=A0A6N8I2I5_9FIRM|nr:stage II sporulation protein R [Caproicibacter fermentans]MVB11880.1 Stage II sporulation protein R (spore_II_R) [Caproicibacter fermentans]OCM99882.1 stage II sporulation protein R [Clostridium sp. W14A]QNK41117.1 stage II sporulation protein R [Caproicibacter fermentans]
MKIFGKALCLAFVIAVLLNFTGFTAGCEQIPSQVLRLHVLANSDTQEDQSLKLKVRDRILQESAGMLDDVHNRNEAEKAVRQRLPLLKKAAQNEIKKLGYDYPVEAKLAKTYFTTRTYGDVTLPAGEYDALEITIGSGKGHNWWCVIFPQLCLPAAQDKKQLEDVLNPTELKIVRDGGGYQIKFKTVEYYEQLKQWLEQR